MNKTRINSLIRQRQQGSRLFQIYYSTLEALCLARYEWTGLPYTVNSDDIERFLFMYGTCSIAAMKDKDGLPVPNLTYVMPYSQVGMSDVYGYPTQWKTNAPPPAMNYDANQRTGACVFATMSALNNFYVPDMLKCLEFAGELEDVALAKRVNRNASKTPFILKVPRQLEETAKAILNKIEGNEGNILAVDDLGEMVKIEVLQTGAQYQSEEYEADEKTVWNRAYSCLGIANVTFKSERMIEDEVLSQEESTNLVELANLKERRRAAAHLNSLFGWDIEVHPSRVPFPQNKFDTLISTHDKQKEKIEL